MARRSDPGFRVIVQLTDRFTKPIDNVNRKIAESTAKVRGLAAIPGAIARSSGLNQIGSAFSNVGSQVMRLRSAVGGLIGPFARLGLAIGGFKLAETIANSVKAGSEFVKLSQKTGVAVEDLQKLGYAAEQAGVSQETLFDGLVKMNKAVADARKGNKETIKAFDAMGISIKDLNSLKPAEVFMRVAGAVSNVSDQSLKMGGAMKVAGKGGAELIPVFNMGTEEIIRLGKELEATGAVMSTDMAQSAKNFGDIMLKVSQHIKGVAYDVLRVLLPGMQDGAGAMDQWVEKNRDWLRLEIVSVVNSIVDATKAFVKIMRDDVLPVLKSLKPAWDTFENIVGKGNAKLIAFTAVVAPGIIGALLGITKAILGVGVALFANPVGAAILAIGVATAFVAYKVWQDWDNIKQQTQATGDALVKTLRETKQNIQDLKWSDITDTIDQAGRDAHRQTQATAGALEKTWGETIENIVGLKWSDVTDTVKEMGRQFRDQTSATFGQLGKTIAEASGTWGQDIRAAWDSIEWPDVGEWIETIKTTISGAAGDLRDAIVSALTSPIEAVKQKWNDLVGWLTGIWSRISGIFGGARNLGGGAAAATSGGGGAIEPIAQPAVAPIWNPNNPVGTSSLGPRALDDTGALARNAAQTSKSEVTVNFENMPQGVRVAESSSTGNTDLTINTAYTGGLAPAGVY